MEVIKAGLEILYENSVFVGKTGENTVG